MVLSQKTCFNNNLEYSVTVDTLFGFNFLKNIIILVVLDPSDVDDIFAVADGIDKQVIAESVRNSVHVTECALAGADIATVPYAVTEAMTKHPLTDVGIAKFQNDYRKVFGE